MRKQTLLAIADRQEELELERERETDDDSKNLKRVSPHSLARSLVSRMNPKLRPPTPRRGAAAANEKGERGRETEGGA